MALHIRDCICICIYIYIYIYIYICVCILDEALKHVGRFHVVSMPWKVNCPTQGVNV